MKKFFLITILSLMNLGALSSFANEHAESKPQDPNGNTMECQGSNCPHHEENKPAH